MTGPRRSPGSRWRRGRAALAGGIAIAMITAAAMLGLAAPALAHDVLVSSDPADGATLTTAPATVSFTFDQPIQNFDPALKVFGPNGNDFATAAPTIAGSVISVPIADGPAGTYRAVYRIVSADGHPVTGQITFTLTGAAAGTATGLAVPGGAPGAQSGATAAATDAGAGTGGSGGIGGWLWVIVAVAAVLVVGAIAVALRRPRDDDPANP